MFMAQNRKLQKLLDSNMLGEGTILTSKGILPMLYNIVTEGGATETASITVDRAMTIVDVWVVLLDGGGANGNVVQIKNAGVAVSEALVVGTFSANGLARVAQLGSAKNVAAGAALQATATDAGSDDMPPLSIYFLCVPQ